LSFSCLLKFSLADFLLRNKLFVMISLMNSVEGELRPEPEGFLKTWHVWHPMTEEKARTFDDLDFNNYEEALDVWIYGPGSGWGSLRLSRKEGFRLSLEEIEKLRPGTWVSHDGSIVRQRVSSSD
jgi:hypothetical protein